MAGVHVRGVQRVSWALRLVGDRAVQAAGDALQISLERVARQERTLLSLGWHPYGTPTGSLPGQPPWRISGHLSRQVHVVGPQMRGLFRLRLVGWVGNRAVYARIHEFGGWTGRDHQTWLPPRPHLEPAWRIVHPSIRPTFAHEVGRAIHRSR